MSLTISTQSRLASAIKAIAQAERQTELARQSLATLSLFEPYTAFRRIDQNRGGQITLSNIIEFLDDNSIAYTQNEATYLFKKLDSDRDGRISYNEFAKFTLPKEDARLRQLAQLRQSYFIDVQMLLPAEVEAALSDIFRQELNNYRQLKNQKDLLVTSLDYSSLEAFRTLDLFNQGYITQDSLTIFMRNQLSPLSYDETNSFFRAVDQDEDGRISYSELIEAVHLMEPLPYRPSVAIEQALRDSSIARQLETSRALERIYLPSYPYYLYPYYPIYYPSYYPYLTLTDIRIRENSLERLRRSRQLDLIRESSAERLRQSRLESDLRISRLEAERRGLERSRELAKSRSLERLQALQQESIERQRQLDNDAYRRRLEQQQREDELRKSRERIRAIETDARQRALDAERENHFQSIERESRIKQMEAEKRLVESEIRLSSIERLNSLERLRRLESIRYPSYYPYAPLYSAYPYVGYPYTHLYDPLYVPSRYIPLSQSQLRQESGTPLKQSQVDRSQTSGLKESGEQRQFQEPQQQEDKSGGNSQGVKRALNQQDEEIQ